MSERIVMDDGYWFSFPAKEVRERLESLQNKWVEQAHILEEECARGDEECKILYMAVTTDMATAKVELRLWDLLKNNDGKKLEGEKSRLAKLYFEKLNDLTLELLEASEILSQTGKISEQRFLSKSKWAKERYDKFQLIISSVCV